MSADVAYEASRAVKTDAADRWKIKLRALFWSTLSELPERGVDTEVAGEVRCESESDQKVGVGEDAMEDVGGRVGWIRMLVSPVEWAAES
jgi:hypothetical protein